MKPAEHIRRNCYPGDRWLFIKVYGGVVMCDRLMVNTIYPLLQKLIKTGVITRWFYIRYSDPEYHLRVRVELADLHDASAVIRLFNKKLASLCDDRRLHKMVIDTYEREVERYGETIMDLTETLFYHDSVCCCSVLKKLMGSRLDSSRWKLSVVMIDTVLGILDYTSEDKLDLVRRIKEGYQREFGFDEHNIKLLAQQYRKIKGDINRAFDLTNDLMGCRWLLDKYQRQLKRTVLGKDVSSLNVSSLMHMSMNRLFASKNRLNELMIYYSLEKYYQSVIIQRKIS